MNKLLFTIAVIIILNILPLIANSQLIINYKILIVIAEGLCLSLTQPEFNIAETKSNKKTDRLSIVFILLATALSIVCAEIEWAYFNNPLQPIDKLSISGLVMIVAGIILRVWAIISLGKNFTATVRIHQEHQLIKNGPYSIVRHPSYTGAFLAITGVAFFLNATISIFISMIIMFAAYYIRIASEEKLLVLYFGDKYVLYSKNKKRLFPFIW